VSTSAREVIAAHLQAQLEHVRAREADVRRGEPDSVHRMRVASRRLSGALATFKPLWEGADTGRLRGELDWLGRVLGTARDAEVMRERLEGLVSEADVSYPPPSRNEAWTPVESALRRDEHEAMVAVTEALDSERYQRILADLGNLAESGPWSAKAERKARPALGPLVGRDWRRVRRRVKKARKASSTASRAELLHRVRKAARRARYAGEAVSPEYGQGAQDFASRAKDVQDILGEHQDSIVSQELLRGLAARNTGADDVLVYGRLLLLEEGISSRARARWEGVWDGVNHKSVTAWLKG
jgi:CHAD domain-containing protein